MEQAVEIMLLQWLFTLLSWYEIVGIYYSLKRMNHTIEKKSNSNKEINIVYEPLRFRQILSLYFRESIKDRRKKKLVKVF